MVEIDKYLEEDKNSAFFLIALVSDGVNSLIWTGNGGTVTLTDHNDLDGVTPIHRSKLKEEFEAATVNANGRNMRGENWQVQIIAFPTFKV